MFNNILIFDIEKLPFFIPIYSKSLGVYSYFINYNNETNTSLIKLPSQQKLFLNGNCFCIIGRNSFIKWNLKKYFKASFFLKFGFKQKVRGVAKNPIDHPHGGRTKTNKPEVSIWGWVTKHSH